MARFNPKSFAQPDLLKRIQVRYFLELLSPHKAFLEARGLPFPINGNDGLDYLKLAGILAQPDEARDSDLVEALHVIGNLGTDELAHVVLHRDVFAQLRFSDIGEWKTQIMGLSAEDREWLEWQAYSWAGLILVPREPLLERLGETIKLAAERGFTVQDVPDPAKDYIFTWLGRQFEVSAQVIEKRLHKDGLWPPSG